MYKLAQTDQQTDQQTGQKQYVPHYYTARRKNAQPPGGHVLQQWAKNVTSRVQTRTNVLTKFHKDWTIKLQQLLYKEKCHDPGGHVFQQSGTIFKLSPNIIRTNVLTTFHEDWTINVTSRVLKRFYYSHIWNL
ncbi:hypothetical protein DPMN_032708 [Dreissena polymorpha]|uniref:Uncharacterized protein n=1 Tax=Dreissena polymorpha TaxID=45954 RepID=A0A9D4M4G2_DREPO|nr:hypothetical protein DPMN_032708 [Dreissena polymorpha]